MRAMILKELRELSRDRRTVALLTFMPLLLLTVFGYAARFDVDDVATAVVGRQAAQVAGELPPLFDVTTTEPGEGRPEAVERLRAGEVTVVLVADDAPRALVDGSQLFSAQAATAALARSPVPLEVEVLFNPGLETATIMIPALIGLVLLFVGTVATSLGVVREREAGTLEHLAVMPLSGRDVFLGKIAPYLLIATLDMALIVGAGLVLFDIPFRGSAPLFAGAGLVFLFVTLGIGVLISTVSRTQGEAIQLALMTLLPQVLLSGLIFPIDSMGEGVRWIAYVLPLTYFIEVARGVMVRGADAGDLAVSLALLVVLAVVVSGAAVLRFRRELAPAVSEAPADREVAA